MPKQLNVNLAFTADTSQAKKSLNDLQISLQKIAKLPGKASSLFDDTDIKNASKAAMELQQHLNAAINVKTGNLDLSRFSTSLKSAKKDLNSYYDQLVKIGPQGKEAFLKLAKTISIAEVPVTRINSKLAEMGVTLKNAARWQISSSILHGFIGTLQGAYGYAQDLNESLNNIRIVTGQSVDEMAKFAEQANKSAKALSTTTTAYTDAALIFYQQGLSGDAVTERTDTVVKMANVTRQSAEEVSSYMTAIWNNFYDGSESLEHYADVITALGAATASSSAEIAEGLSKFASVAETIGLSYDYATSILAALVANTRQSADTVGTALKTILARLQSVKLGETLDDGTELTKYTQALQTIGVSIFDLNGNMKDADEILEDTAAKWDTLTKAQQAGVAQTVAGTRQYAQFIAIMENWGDVQKNLGTAKGAEGTLQDQADIYAESWEAASKRVKAAAQGIYQNLLDDKFFISLNDNLAKLLQTIDGVVKGFGGMKGIITSVGSLFLTYYAKNMPDALNNLKQNFMVFTGAATNEMIKMQTKTGEILSDMKKDTGLSNSFKTEAEGIATVIEMQKKYILAQKSMTESQRRDYEARIANVQAMYGELKALELEIEKLQEEAKAKQKALSSKNIVSELTSNRNQQDAIRTQLEEVGKSTDINDVDKTKTINSLTEMLQKLETKEGELLAKTALLKQEFIKVKLDPELLNDADKLKDEIDIQTEKLKEQLISWRQISETSDELPQIAKKWKLNAVQIGNNSNKMEEFKKNVDLYISSLNDMYKNNKAAFSNTGMEQTISDIEKLKKEFDSGNISAEEFAKEFEKLSATMKTQMNSAANAVNNDLEEIRKKLAVMLKDNPEALKEIEKTFDELGIKIKNLNDSKVNTKGMVDNPNNISQASIAMTQFASAAMSTYSAINSLKNAFNTFDKALKGEADSFEVIGAVVSSFMATMMALNAVQKVSETLSKSAVISKLAEAAAENTVIGAKITDIAVTLGLEAACVPLLVVILLLVSAMASLALTILTVVAAIKFFQENSPEGKLKALKEEAAECSKTFEETKVAAEELKSVFDDYDSLVDKLNECTQGTQEWRDALADVNNAVLELMSNYPELIQYVTRGDNGQLTISNEGMTKMRNNADAAIMNAQLALLKANTDVKNQEISMKAESIAKNPDLAIPRWLEDKLYNDPQSLSSYDAIRQMIADDYGSEYIENPLDKNSEEFQKYLDEQLLALKDLEGMDELIAAIQANTEAQEIGNQAIANNILANNTQIQGSKYVDNVTAAAGDIYNQLYKDAMKNLEDDGWGTSGISKATKVNDEAKRVFEEYAKAANITGATLINTTGTDKDRKFVYKDKNGEEVTVSLDAMRRIKAAADAQEQLGEAAQNLIKTFTELDKTGQKYDKALIDILSDKSFENSTQSEIDELKDLIAKNENGIEGVLGEKFGGEDKKLSNKEANALGFDSVKDMIEAFEKSIEDYDKAVENLGNNWLESVQDAFNNLQDPQNNKLKDLDLSQQKTIGDAMNQAFAIGGEEGLKTFTDIIDNIPTNKIDEFAQILSTIDWQNTSVKDLKEQLKDAGINTAGFDERLQNLINVMQTDGVKSVDKLTEAYKKTADIIKDLKDGDIISADDYAALDENSQKYFQLMMDGTYQLIGNAEELQRLLNGNGVESFRESIKNYQDQNEDYNRIKNYDFDTLSTTRANSAGEGKFNSSEVQQQLDLLKVLKGAEEEQIALWQQELDSGTISVSSLDEIAIAVQGCGTEYNRLNELIASNNAQIEAQKEALAASCTSLAQLDGMLADTTISTEAYNKALDNVTRTEAEIHKLDYDDIIDQAKALAKAYRLDESAARQLAIQNQRLNRGLANLVNNLDDWKKGLKETDKTSMDYIDTVQEMSAAIVDMVGASEDLKLDGTFMEDNLDLITKAAEGSEEAINNLGIEVARFQVEAMQNPIDPTTINGASSAQAYQEFENWKSTILSGIDELQTNLDDLKIGDNVFDKLGGDDWVESLNQMALTTRMSVDEMNSLLNSMGVQAEVSMVRQKQTISVPQYHTQREHIKRDERGNIVSYDESTYQIDNKTVDGYVEVAQINTGDAIGKKPTITYTGNSSPSTSAGNGKKGSGKTPEHKTKDKVEKFEADPFHKVNQELEDVSHNLAIINKQQSHMFGKELINNLKQQNAELSKQISLHKQKAQIAKDEANALRAQLEAQGVAFDGDNIANYNAMLQAAEAQINILIAQYNALSAAEQEAWDNAAKDGNDPIKEAEKRYENLKKMMDKYVNYMSIVYSEEEAALDALYQQIENNLKAYEIEIELKLDTTDAERALNKFLKNIRTDIKNLYKSSSEWADVFSTAVKDAQTYVTDNQTKLDQLNKYKQIYANKQWGGENDLFVSESEVLKAITDLQKELLEDSENILNLYQDAYSNLKDAFGEVADQFNDIIDEFQRIDDTLDHYEKVIELLHGGSETEQGRKELDQLYKIRKENSLATQDSLRQYIQALEVRKQAALANGFDADDSYIRDIEEEINNANDKLTSEIEDYIDTIQRELENSIKMAQAAMDKNVWGDTTANVSQEWDDKKAQAEGYYDTVERIYQLESLESKWKTAITSTSSLKAQQQLTELMNKQVEALESKTVLSEKDIELAEKELQVYQAQIALEDAQNNKNSMKLTRDEAGNWSYQYVADEGDVSNKQQDYLNKINEWRTASINATEEIAEKTMQAYETFSERMSEIMNDVTLSEEERNAKIQALNETYWGEEGIITRLVEDSNYIQGVANRATYEELASLYLADEDNVTRMTETEQELIATMIENGITSYSNLRDFVAGDDGKSGVYGEIKEACIETNKDSSAAWKSMAADAISRMYKDPDSVKNTINLAYKEMTDALSNYDKAIVASEQASGREWSKVDKQLITTQGNIQGVWNKVDAVIQKSYELNIFEQNVLNIKNAWEQVAQATQEATKELLTYMSYLNNGSDSGGNGGGSGSGGKGGGSGSGSSGSGTGDTETGAEGEQKGSTNTLDKDTAWGIAAAIWTEGDSAWFNGSTRQSRITEKFGDGAYEQIQSIINAHSANGDLYNYWKNNLGGNAKAYHYSSFDTGGYTGDWSGGDGRLAMLHSKELVLNQNDTENILSAVNAVREIASLGDSISNAIANGISNMIMSLAGLGKNNYNSYNNKIETNNGNNTFEITMNVDGGDVQEIQRAILDLPNLASQFLSKK